nr:SpaA isopeptide-forming pilin-related protein [Corynebacterium lactis]
MKNVLEGREIGRKLLLLMSALALVLGLSVTGGGIPTANAQTGQLATSDYSFGDGNYSVSTGDKALTVTVTESGLVESISFKVDKSNGIFAINPFNILTIGSDELKMGDFSRDFTVSLDSASNTLTFTPNEPKHIEAGQQIVAQVMFNTRDKRKVPTKVLDGSIVVSGTPDQATPPSSDEPTTDPTTPPSSDEPTTSPNPGEPTTPPNPSDPNARRQFEVIGHDFPVTANDYDPQTADTFYATVGNVSENTRFKSASLRIETGLSFLTPQSYSLLLDKIEPGVGLEKRNVVTRNGYITMDIVPVKDGQQVANAQVPAGAIFTFNNGVGTNPKLKVVLDVYGEEISATPEPPQIITPPDGATWVHGRVPNPPMPQRCGLRVAVVADFSTSLNYADLNGFEASRRAANALVDSLAGTPAEIGLYNFAGNAPSVANGTTVYNNPPYISLQDQAGVNQAKSVINNWRGGGGATNWEAGLAQVAGQHYDVVYFITDGMPTYSDETARLKASGGMTQESALNAAIDQANQLKAEGTRIVPIMVDLTLGGTSNQRYTVTEDLVLKNLRDYPYNGAPSEPGLYFLFNRNAPQTSRYLGYEGSQWIVNFKQAYNARPRGVTVYEKQSNGRLADVTADQAKWTYGPRGVQTMGEDISGTGDTIRVKQYSQLADQMRAIAQDLSNRCAGAVIVKKRIVDEQGNVIQDGAPGWEFSLIARSNVIDSGNGFLVHSSLKSTKDTPTAKGQAEWAVNSETSQSLTLTETQKQGYSIFKRGNSLDSAGDFNAVCTQTLSGRTSPLSVTNEGEFGFSFQMAESQKRLATVSCTVDNYEVPTAPPGKLRFEKAEYVDGQTNILPGLGGATFEVYAATGTGPDYSKGALHTIESGQDSIEIKETGTYYLVETKSPSGLSLLPEPVGFEIAQDPQTKEYKVAVVSGSSPLITASGSGQTMLIQVADVKTGTLPKTGGFGVGLPVLAGLVLAACGIAWSRRRSPGM